MVNWPATVLLVTALFLQSNRVHKPSDGTVANEKDTGQRTLWKQLMPPDPAGVEYVGPILPTPDGKAYVYGYRRMLSDLYVVDGLK